MLQRFAAATCVASPALALATLIALLVPRLKPDNLYPLTTLWCFVPAVWGLWAMLAPTKWVPQRLPLWGTILGVIVGTVVVFVLNLPAHFAQIFEVTPSVAQSVARRGVAVLLLVALYYLLWLVVRAAFGALAGHSRADR